MRKWNCSNRLIDRSGKSVGTIFCPPIPLPKPLYLSPPSARRSPPSLGQVRSVLNVFQGEFDLHSFSLSSPSLLPRSDPWGSINHLFCEFLGHGERLYHVLRNPLPSCNFLFLQVFLHQKRSNLGLPARPWWTKDRRAPKS